MKNTQTILLILSIFVLFNLLGNQFSKRIDLTKDKQYTLSTATNSLLKTLTEPVTVKAYFSEGLPEVLTKTKNDVQELLIEYNAISKGNLVYEFITPSTPEQELEAKQSGIFPRQVQTRESNEVKLANLFCGAIIEMGDRKEPIPFFQPGGPTEYMLTTSIKKLAAAEKASVGLLQGHGEPTIQALGQAGQAINTMYNLQAVNLGNEGVPSQFGTLLVLSPKDSFPPSHFAFLDAFLGRGGKLLVALDLVKGDLQNAQGTLQTTGFETWLKQKGVEVEGAFITDTKCGSVTVSSGQQGLFNFGQQVQFHYFPMSSNFSDHPVTKGIEQVMFPFASGVKASNDQVKFTPIAKTSNQTGRVIPPVTFDVMKRWQGSDFPMGTQTLGALVEGNFSNDTPSKMIVFGDGEFLTLGQNPSNVTLFFNCVDWLADDSGLFDLRMKSVASRPLKEVTASKKKMITYFNFLFPVLLIFGYGFFRAQRRRATRMKRMQENYG